MGTGPDLLVRQFKVGKVVVCGLSAFTNYKLKWWFAPISSQETKQSCKLQLKIPRLLYWMDGWKRTQGTWLWILAQPREIMGVGVERLKLLLECLTCLNSPTRVTITRFWHDSRWYATSTQRAFQRIGLIKQTSLAHVPTWGMLLKLVEIALMEGEMGLNYLKFHSKESASHKPPFRWNVSTCTFVAEKGNILPCSERGSNPRAVPSHVAAVEESKAENQYLDLKPSRQKLVLIKIWLQLCCFCGFFIIIIIITSAAVNYSIQEWEVL